MPILEFAGNTTGMNVVSPIADVLLRRQLLQNHLIRVHTAPGKPGKRPFFENNLENLEKHLEKLFFVEKYYESLKTQEFFFNIHFS